VLRRALPPDSLCARCVPLTKKKTACTSDIVRSNLTIRMMLRWFTRLTNAYSKSWRHHAAALASAVRGHNFDRKHMTIGCTPAEAAGLTDHTWSYKD